MADHPVSGAHPPKRLYRIVNRVMRWLLSSPRRARRVGNELLVLHLTGRKTGRPLDIPVAYEAVTPERLRVLTSSPWRVNLRGRPEVEVTLRGVRRPATADLIEDPQAVAEIYHAAADRLGHKKAGRRMGIRITVDRVPTADEFEEAARRDGLSVVHLDLGAAS
ncbi:MAG: nitroreductase family deazaflavin-dependent oxidoreductase [Proteobacteria bacterium]|nr:nitroreductase family deazaflavin-dependent oxidoreductase [Pseudomonadota bacterium]